jgi:hypothetical protein
MDVHVPRPITRGLRRRGVDVLTAQEDGTDRLEDGDLLNRAMEVGRILFSQDEDLLIEAARRQREGISFGGVIYAPQIALSIGQSIDDLELLAKAAVREDFTNLVQYLPLAKTARSISSPLQRRHTARIIHFLFTTEKATVCLTSSPTF